MGCRANVFSLKPAPVLWLAPLCLALLRRQIGAQVNTYPSTWIYFPWNLTVGDWSAIGEQAFIYNLGPVTLGEKVTVSHRAQLCAGTHDYTQLDLPLLKPPIVVCDQAWICADAFVGPGVTVGEGAIVGARAVVTKNVEPWVIVAGNPAKLIKKRILNGQPGESPAQEFPPPFPVE